ncbi:MAG: hypothetical protein V5A38_03690 [Halolamina sp.]|uniref:hypothetical protein n=1 Tax=Halolamina sp. TaxID=1940283 RepID=UPI002FC3B5F6
MRRIYESEALSRDDDTPFVPGEEGKGRQYRSINWENASHALVPQWVRPLAIDVSIETNQTHYHHEEPVAFRVEFRNRLPIPISLSTLSPVRWTWALDDIEEASHVERPVPDEGSTFQFDRAERKRFTRQWSQQFRESKSEWEVAEPGEHTVSVQVNTDRGVERLSDSATFVIEE